jgi:hypothetical protein|uniref:Uncharacterized protein n=1 Tax=Sipha flava TaxID=143950 RepID=A0A2S2R511_9HEMI
MIGVTLRESLKNIMVNLFTISEKCGSLDAVTLRDTVNNIIRKYYEKPKDCDLELQKIQIIEAAAKLIMSDVKCIEIKKTNFYSTVYNLTSENALKYLPNSLKLFCITLFVGKNVSCKISAIGQSIVHDALHIMSGKTVYRAIHAHLIVDAALNIQLASYVLKCNEDGSENIIYQDMSDL